MGRKAGKYKKKENNDVVKKKSVRFDSDNEDMMDDEIDAFHKNRDVVPLDVNQNLEESDEDNEHPVFDLEDDKDEDDENEDEDDDIDDDDNPPTTGLAAKIIRTQKYLRDKFGGNEDEMLDDADEEEQQRIVWGPKKDMYGADVDYEPQSSDDEDAAEEEAEAKKLQTQRLKDLSMEDLGLDTSEDERDREPTFEEILDGGKPTPKASLVRGSKEEDGMEYEIVKKDLNALTKEEQMDVVFSSAPELIGLLSELNDTLDQLENKVNPLMEKIRKQDSAKKGGMHYMEVKQLLLQSFCQTITFYLLLKSEGQPVRDHPVVSRLVEIKSLLDKMKAMDDNLPFDMEDILKKEVETTPVLKLVDKTAPMESDSLSNGQIYPVVPSKQQATVERKKESESNTLKSSKSNESQQKHQDKQIGLQSIEMLKIRASLEEKLKQKGVFSSVAPKIASREHLQPMNRQLETLDDFVDEAVEIGAVANGRSNGDANLSHSSKFSQQLTLHPNKRKAVSGDDDIPKRDDIGERRRKHELRVLAGAGIKYGDDDETGNASSDGEADANEEFDADSDLEFYKEVERQHAAKSAAKSNKYSRTSEIPSLPEAVDGKRDITNQILKNRGLTRARKKLIKNPRKKYKLKHKKAEMRLKGQRPAMKKPTGSYGGEASGINAGVSRSVRFKS